MRLFPPPTFHEIWKIHQKYVYQGRTVIILTKMHCPSFKYYDGAVYLSEKAVVQKIERKSKPGWFDKAHFSKLAESGIV